MLLKNLSQIKKDVRIVLDENEDVSALTSVIGDSDALETDAITEAMILKAIDKVHIMAPLGMISSAGVDLDDDEWSCTKYGNVAHLPSDFLRLVAVKAVGWTNAVYVAVDESSSEYKMQSSKFDGVRATKRCPVAAIVPDVENGGLNIEIYPKQVPTEDETGIAGKYICKASIIKQSGVSYVYIADRCYDAMLYMTANLYYQTVGDQAKANAMAMEAAEMMGMAKAMAD